MAGKIKFEIYVRVHEYQKLSYYVDIITSLMIYPISIHCSYSSIIIPQIIVSPYNLSLKLPIVCHCIIA